MVVESCVVQSGVPISGLGIWVTTESVWSGSMDWEQKGQGVNVRGKKRRGGEGREQEKSKARGAV